MLAIMAFSASTTAMGFWEFSRRDVLQIALLQIEVLNRDYISLRGCAPSNYTGLVFDVCQYLGCVHDFRCGIFRLYPLPKITFGFVAPQRILRLHFVRSFEKNYKV